MKQTKIPKMVALIGAGAIAILCAHAQTSTTSVATLEPIAFLTAHEWDAQLPDSPDGKKKKFTPRLRGHKTVRPFASATNWSPAGRRVLTSTGFMHGIRSSVSSSFGTWTQKEVSRKAR